jgi:hypothetical protein
MVHLPARRLALSSFKKEISLAGRGQTTFKKRQKEQQRKDRQLAKMEKRLQRKNEVGGESNSETESESPDQSGPDAEDQTQQG